ncbi:MAG: Gfo/Idh/MocA family oxidoreductase [Peptoniphilaceae bacterium]|nr:Gfo/Idh/MocA family oxidoreductase [Peptoniphilaceae bacterium]
MNIALIGCGRIAINHMKAIQNTGLNLVALCDVIPSKMDALLEKSGMAPDGIAKYTDHRTLLEEQRDLDLVAIATESGVHAAIALDCIAKGVNVMIEKPMAMSMADADRIIEKAEAHHVKVGAIHQNRFNVAIQKLRKAVEDGRFGQISHGSIHVRWNRNRAYYEQAPWRGTWAHDGGCLMNQCIHGIDLLRWMLGDEVVEVYGQTRQQQHDYLEAEDLGTAIVTFKNGAVGIVEGTTNVYPKNLEESLFVFGEKGTVKIGGKSTTDIEVWDFEDLAEEEKALVGMKEPTSNIYGNGHTAYYRDMIDAIANDRPPYVDAYAGRRALELVLAIYKSQKTGKPVKLPLTDFASTDMEGTFGEGSLDYREDAPVVEAE